MTNLERYQALQAIPGEFIFTLGQQEHLFETDIKGSITSPITWVDLEEHRFVRFLLDDGVDHITCHCRPDIFPEEYDSTSIFGVKGYLTRADEVSVFCYSIERRDPVA